ncbi:hypothetical protein [Arcobacter defluvii]|uniref:DNA-binding protein n=1 Tax=Arcobacter defluvii TaxID=873191 RepID=A0AAE7BH83_9BACT|nr:hypothetical protein [Arcobacter defluvii]QKF77275.1 hypothetical protein ADFLV_1243 [Arcobacter defluvii]QKF77881.1 hypothetical protein ADFLV_1863 [Arcobacter defluvii]RXI32662.1 hypothetical protein CP964_07290 [Arcobacter defluvii]
MEAERIFEKFFVNQAEILIDNLLSHYNASTYSELASKINTTQQSISSWKLRNSINAIKKKCKELGIYNEIFKDFNKQQINKNEIKINDTLLEQVKDKASKFGLELNSYIEYLIIQDLKK